MTDIGVGNFMKLWQQSDIDSERLLQKFLLGGLDKAERQVGSVLSKIPKGPPCYNPVVRWGEQIGYPTQVTATLTSTTLAISGTLFGQAVTEELIKRVIRVGTILERPSDGMQIKVTSIAGIDDGSSTWDATVAAYGNTSLGNDTSGAITYDIISEVWSDYTDASQPRNVDRKLREVGTQIFAETFDIPKTRLNTKYEFVVDEKANQIDELLLKLARQESYVVLRSRPYWTGSAYAWGLNTDQPTMLGLEKWPVIVQAEQANANVYVNKANTALYKRDLNALLYHLRYDELANYKSGDWWIVCHPLVMQAIHDMDFDIRETTRQDGTVGSTVQTFHSQEAKDFPIMTDEYMTPGVLMVVNFAKTQRGSYNQDEMDRKEIPTQGRYQRWLISFQRYGVVVRNPRANIGMIYGIATS